MLSQALFYLLDRTHYWKKMFFILSRDWDKGTHDQTKNIFFHFFTKLQTYHLSYIIITHFPYYFYNKFQVHKNMSSQGTCIDKL